MGMKKRLNKAIENNKSMDRGRYPDRLVKDPTQESGFRFKQGSEIGAGMKRAAERLGKGFFDAIKEGRA